jgi:hypothetical protein
MKIYILIIKRAKLLIISKYNIMTHFRKEHIKYSDFKYYSSKSIVNTQLYIKRN